jgi:hypothetical protein
VGAQGLQFASPISPSNQYYAFLSKADLDETTQLYDVFFELISKEWMDNAVLSAAVDIIAPAPSSPALAYHIPAVEETSIVQALGLKSIDFLAEGSWYLLKLKSGSSGVYGDLYDPAIDAIKWHTGGG